MSSGTHQRTAMEPGGREEYPFVFTGNVLLARYAILVLVGMARGVLWLVENPLRTTLHLHPCVKHILHSEFRPLMVKWSWPELFV